jgi:protein-tyrosine kinase
MSRIDEALQKARELQASGLTTAHLPEDTAAAGKVPSPAVFDAPWAFADAPGARREDSSNDVAREASVVRAGGRDSEKQAILLGPWSGSPDGQAEPIPVAGASSLAVFQGFNPAIAERIVATPEARPDVVEQYRRLAGYLHHAQLERSIRTVMVTSAVPMEGKTLTAANLALTLSESYHRKVLLIDADLRRPAMHEIFRVPNVSGLGEGLHVGGHQRLALVQVSSRLALLTAGRPEADPMAGLTSDRMRQILQEATASFEWVVIDTPPVGLLPDAKILGSMVDSTLLVIRAGKTPYALVTRAVEQVGRERIIGVVLNQGEDGLEAGYTYSGYYTRQRNELVRDDKR